MWQTLTSVLSTLVLSNNSFLKYNLIFPVIFCFCCVRGIVSFLLKFFRWQKSFFRFLLLNRFLCLFGDLRAKFNCYHFSCWDKNCYIQYLYSLYLLYMTEVKLLQLQWLCCRLNYRRLIFTLWSFSGNQREDEGAEGKRRLSGRKIVFCRGNLLPDISEWIWLLSDASGIYAAY